LEAEHDIQLAEDIHLL